MLKIYSVLCSIMAKKPLLLPYILRKDRLTHIKHVSQTWYNNDHKHKILVIDASTPTPDQDSGSLDTFLALQVLVELHYDVTFIPSDLKRNKNYTSNIASLGVRCLHKKEIYSIENFLSATGKFFDVVMLYRLGIAESHLPNVRKLAPQAKIVFNTVDLHFLREERIAEVENSELLRSNAARTKAIELAMMRSVDATIVLSSAEFDLVRNVAPSVNCYLLPFFRRIPGRSNPFSKRKDIVFIGGFKHQPNIDAITYFINDVWPLVRRRIADVHLLILGSHPTKAVYNSAKNDDRIKVVGFVKNLNDYFDICRMSVAPIRTGAGIKGKIVTSAGYGVPCVATSLAIEGMGLTPESDILVADTPAIFAEKVIKLYNDEVLWTSISNNALEFMESQFAYQAGKTRLELFFSSIIQESREQSLPSPPEKDQASAERSIGVKNKLTVVVEIPSFDKGGLEKVVLDSVVAFDKELIDCIIVTSGALGHLSQQAEACGIKVVQFPDNNREFAYQHFLEMHRPQLSISHFSHQGYPLFHALSIPNITFIHNVYAFMSDEQRNIFLRSDPYVQLYIAVSPKAATYAEHNLSVSKDKIIIIPNGLSLSEHEQREKRDQCLSRQQFGFAKNDYVFINPASYNLHKGHYVMVEALKIVRKTRNDIKILCVGNEINSPHIKQLRKYIKSVGLTDHMLMPGYFKNIEDVMRICDACLMPSFIEGWSIAMNEAMFYRKPLILTDTGGASEVIENNDIGILIPNEYGLSDSLDRQTLDELAYTPHRYKISALIANAMINFADNRQYWKQAGELGRQKIYSRHSFSCVVKQYEELMVKVAQQSLVETL